MREQVPQLVPRRAGQSRHCARGPAQPSGAATERVWAREMGSELHQSAVPELRREPMRGWIAAAGPPCAGLLSQSRAAAGRPRPSAIGIAAGGLVGMAAGRLGAHRPSPIAHRPAPHACSHGAARIKNFPTCNLELTKPLVTAVYSP
ncbi:unnamed protein product [Coccothraustes coccothraustes]